MSATGNSKTCMTICWVLSVVVGLVIVIATLGTLGVVFALILGLACMFGSRILLIKLICGADDQSSEAVADANDAPSAPAPAPAPKPPAPVAEPAPGPVAEAPEPQETPSADVVTSTQLPGQTELATRKGTWRYEPEPTHEQAASTAPARLEAARDSQADDLKLIKGVGPKLETLLHRMGYFHFDQIAGWTAPDVAWMDDNLEGFKGRVTRDDWVDQAKILASGGETEFSKRKS